MLVEWRPRAIRRLDAIHERIQEDSITAADFVFDAIVAAAAALPDHPYVPRGSCAEHAGNGRPAELHRCLSNQDRPHHRPERAARAATLSDMNHERATT